MEASGLSVDDKVMRLKTQQSKALKDANHLHEMQCPSLMDPKQC